MPNLKQNFCARYGQTVAKFETQTDCTRIFRIYVYITEDITSVVGSTKQTFVQLMCRVGIQHNSS